MSDSSAGAHCVALRRQRPPITYARKTRRNPRSSTEHAALNLLPAIQLHYLVRPPPPGPGNKPLLGCCMTNSSAGAHCVVFCIDLVRQAAHQTILPPHSSDTCSTEPASCNTAAKVPPPRALGNRPLQGCCMSGSGSVGAICVVFCIDPEKIKQTATRQMDPHSSNISSSQPAFSCTAAIVVCPTNKSTEDYRTNA